MRVKLLSVQNGQMWKLQKFAVDLPKVDRETKKVLQQRDVVLLRMWVQTFAMLALTDSCPLIFVVFCHD